MTFAAMITCPRRGAPTVTLGEIPPLLILPGELVTLTYNIILIFRLQCGGGPYIPGDFIKASAPSRAERNWQLLTDQGLEEEGAGRVGPL